MKNKTVFAVLLLAVGLSPLSLSAQIGRRFPSEKKVVPDPVTGVPLTFLTSSAAGDSKIYQTHHQWTSDGKWVIFRSNRARGQAMAVNEETGDMVQVTDAGYSGMLCLADHSMNLYFARMPGLILADATGAPGSGGAMVSATDGTPAPGGPSAEQGARTRPRGPAQIIRVDLEKLFADSAAGKVGPASNYEHVCGTVPEEMGNVGDVALDPTEDFIYFRVSNHEIAGKHLPTGTEAEKAFGPRGMGAGPTGLASMNLKTGEIKFIVAVPFQIGHVQTNPWVPGEIVFCWETGGKAKQRTWTVRSDGTGLRPLYPEADYEWITHEAVITKDEVAIAIIALRRPGFYEAAAQSPAAIPASDITPADTALPGVAQQGQGQGQGGRGRGGQGRGNTDPRAWGPAGAGDKPTGLGIVNLRTREMRIVSQVPVGNPGRSVWHVNGSADGRWAVADDFQYRLWLTDRRTGECIMLADLGRKTGAADHIHPTFNADGTKIEIQTAMLSEDGRTMNICVVPVPKPWLARTYSDKIQ